MSNNPVMGIAICPYCKGRNPLVWNGNRRYPCIYCHKLFNIKRQKLQKVKHIDPANIIDHEVKIIKNRRRGLI